MKTDAKTDTRGGDEAALAFSATTLFTRPRASHFCLASFGDVPTGLAQTSWNGDREFDLRSRTNAESRVDTALRHKRTTIIKIKNRRITKERIKIIVIIIVILISTAERICYALAHVINALQEIKLPCQQQQS